MFQARGAGAQGTAAGRAPEQRAGDDDFAGTRRLSEDEEAQMGTDVIGGDRKANFSVLDRSACFELLGSRDIGRVAFTIDGDAAPTVLPVNYALLNDVIVFRSTLAGTIMRYARGHAAFQVDLFDDERREGWSVLATGHCRWVRDANELARIPQGRLPQPWAEGSRDQVLKITPGRVTGRRISRT
ncbi:pyridoxamine 5'-phosphate oxidase family protein [Nocardiopsis algeriensis]|uniref:Nitroimidazol reductase NimA-like FMN-containing flavoprotein (Pyridoxamine 5'-phosphate oxidase superfamily) n=1 Tax=Nocardiopsis algeriensis TaxID=1478215 RepID=A0A841IUF8_9ACTN|nr:pyridoxamine 5'-phosphate oxidase family protein [Nocardiopsis algeriensis]MBB6119861.1 nitroimidazol reductase NimA-like FMN-containing flavoprotein (pyridoxamine 5'-phosphate oxidase superfamily) [Nocardiopsis algeriensis]